MSTLCEIPTLQKSARALPDTPVETEYFREYDYSQPYFVEGTPVLFGDGLPLLQFLYDGSGEGISYLSPVKDPQSVHVPGVDNASAAG